MEKVSPVRTIKAGGAVHAFAKGQPFPPHLDIDAYMASQRAAGLIIVQDNKIRREKQPALDYTASGRWTSFSVAKSVTSTLACAALRDGYIRSLDDKVSKYIPAMKGSVYDDVTIRQLLTMTSGVKWNKDYSDPNSDVALFNKHQPDPGVDVTVSYMRRLKREAPAGSKWLYKTGETNLLGVLVSQATGKTLSDYLSEKVWKPYGMEQDAVWMLGSTGHEISGCCISATLRDYARFGEFISEGAKIHGKLHCPGGLARTGDCETSRHRCAGPRLRFSMVDLRRRQLRRIRHLRTKHLHRPQAQTGDRDQRRLAQGGGCSGTAPRARRVFSRRAGGGRSQTLTGI